MLYRFMVEILKIVTKKYRHVWGERPYGTWNSFRRNKFRNITYMQRDFFQNATQPDTAVSIDKKQMIWPLIVLLVDQTAANDYKKDFDDDECLEIERKYRAIINQQTMLYEFFYQGDYRS